MSADELFMFLPSKKLAELFAEGTIDNEDEFDVIRRIIGDKVHDLIAVIGFRQMELPQRDLAISDMNGFNDRFLPEFCDIFTLDPLANAETLKLLFDEFVVSLRRGAMRQGWGMLKYREGEGIVLETEAYKARFGPDEIPPGAEIIWNEFPE